MRVVVIGEDNQSMRVHRSRGNHEGLHRLAMQRDCDTSIQPSNRSVELFPLARELPPSLAVPTVVELLALGQNQFLHTRERSDVLACTIQRPVMEVDHPT